MSNDDQSCHVCGRQLTLELRGAADPQSGDRFDILRCSSCGLGQTSPVPANLQDYYSNAYYGRRHSFTAHYCTSRRIRIVERGTAGVRGSLLDIGCGDGTFLRRASKQGYSVVGTEVGAQAAQARALGLDVRLSLDDVADRAPFDVVTMWHTLEHFTSPRTVVETVGSLLRDGGVFVIAVPNSQGLQARAFRTRWFHLDVPRHVYHFGQKSLEILLRRSGFEIEHWYHQELEYDMMGWLQSGLNTITSSPNTLFQAMTGKRTNTSNLAITLQYAMASVLAPAASVATLVGSALRRGGTLVAMARRRAA